jgi:hypothetical protein
MPIEVNDEQRVSDEKNHFDHKETAMSKRTVTCFLSLALLVALSSAAFAGSKPSLTERLDLLASRPIMDVLQAQSISGEERTTAYIYADRIEYYDNALLSEIEKLGKLPATASNGVLFTEIFLTQFRKHPGLYVVQRGWDKDGNCHVLTTPIKTRRPNATAGFKDDEPEIEAGNSCSGDPCSKCKPYDPTFGCQCEIGTRCNHTISN